MTINFYDSALSLASNFGIFVLQYFEIGITINQGGSYTPVVDVHVVEVSTQTHTHIRVHISVRNCFHQKLLSTSVFISPVLLFEQICMLTLN